MNHMSEIAKLLGVEIGEEFRLSNSEYIYKIVDNGLLRKNKPNFKKWAMYKGMKLEKEYSLEELGL